MCAKICAFKYQGKYMKHTKEELEIMLENSELESKELEALLVGRGEGVIDFKLVDVRELFEYTSSSILNTDLLIPTSMIQKHINKFEELKEQSIILYCRTGNRTSYVMSALKNMGLNRVIHLTRGIVAYNGKVVSEAKIPNEL